MRFLTTRLHGAIDYLLAFVLVALAWTLELEAASAARWLPFGLGLLLLAYSLCTDYELAVLRRLEVTVHLWLDAFVGLLLAVSPWLFGFDREVWLPHLALGVLLVAVAFLTNTIPGFERRGRDAARV